MKSASRKWIVVVVLIIGASSLAWAIFNRLQEHRVPTKRGRASRVAPVEVARIEHGPIHLRRTFSGALESPAAFVVRPKISGRIVRFGVAPFSRRRYISPPPWVTRRW